MISTRGRYALRIMIELAENADKGYIAMKEAAERQEISLKYLEKIMPSLVANGFVEGQTGKGGGYRLTRDPSEYSVGEILRVTEGDMAPATCLSEGAEPCARDGNCRTKVLWDGLRKTVEDYLNGVTLADLMKTE